MRRRSQRWASHHTNKQMNKTERIFFLSNWSVPKISTNDDDDGDDE